MGLVIGSIFSTLSIAQAKVSSLTFVCVNYNFSDIGFESKTTIKVSITNTSTLKAEITPNLGKKFVTEASNEGNNSFRIISGPNFLIQYKSNQSNEGVIKLNGDNFMRYVSCDLKK